METNTIKTEVPELIPTKLHYYWLDISKPEDKEEYKKIKALNKSYGWELFDCISFDNKAYMDKIKNLDGRTVHLETTHLFDNQWNSKEGLRLHEWYESIVQNKKIKIGYYLEPVEIMNTIRQDTYKCGYCGKQYYKPGKDQIFCVACIGSEYLKVDQLYMLQLRPIIGDYKKIEIVPDEIVQLYNSEQETNLIKRLKKRNADTLTSLQKNIDAAKKEFDGFSVLIHAGIDYDNVIYYNHTDTFSFGWRNSIPESERAELIQKIEAAKFPYKYEIK